MSLGRTGTRVAGDQRHSDLAPLSQDLELSLPQPQPCDLRCGWPAQSALG